MSVYRYANPKFWIPNDESLSSHFIYYRHQVLEYSKSTKNGYDYNIHKDTPENLKKIFAAFDRKIKNKPFFKKERKKEYLDGYFRIWELYYEELSKWQNPSKRQKKYKAEHDAFLKKLGLH